MSTHEIPRPGLGTWQITDHDRCVDAVAHALELGYRHVDTAAAYRNEAGVGQGLRTASVDRDAVFVATKIWIDDLGPDAVRPAAQACLDRLGLDRVDLLYVHWPAGTYAPRETLPAMAELVDDGLTRTIGVSNFTPALLHEAVDVAGDVLLAHQFEMHAYLPNDDVRTATIDHDLVPVAYSPLARGAVLDDPVIGDIADEHRATPAQVALAWLMSLDGVVPIPKSKTPEHIGENLAARDVRLTAEDRERIVDIDRRERAVDPDFAPWL